MSIYLDSADIAEAKEALGLGWIRGITTNPLLLKRTGAPAREVLGGLAELNPAQIFYQLCSLESLEVEREIAEAAEILGEKLVLKIPPTVPGFRLASQISAKWVTCITAIYCPAQAIAASEAGARYVAVYVNRASKWLGDGVSLTAALASAVKGSSTAVLAASLKSVGEAEEAHTAGASHLTLSWNVLRHFLDNNLSKTAVEQFNKEGMGLLSTIS